MRSPHKIIVSVVAAFLILVGAALLLVQTSQGERAQIRTRYHEMREALASQDKNAALAFIAPEFRDSFYDWRFTNLTDFAQPLSPRSSIVVFGKTAIVWPERTYHFVVLPGGNTIEMVKTDGDWFFTGKYHID